LRNWQTFWLAFADRRTGTGEHFGEFIAVALAEILRRGGHAVLVQVCGLHVGGRAGLPQRADDGVGGALTVVAVVTPGVERVAGEIDLQHPALQVVEVGRSGVEDGLGLLDGHVAFLVVDEAEALGPGSVEERGQHGCTVEIADVDVHVLICFLWSMYLSLTILAQPAHFVNSFMYHHMLLY